MTSTTAKPEHQRINTRIKRNLLLVKEVVRGLDINDGEDWAADDVKVLQEDVEDNEAKKETPIYVGCIYCCTRLTRCSLECKFMEYILAFVVSLFASAISTTFALYMVPGPC